jgi:hypothetical protein
MAAWENVLNGKRNMALLITDTTWKHSKVRHRYGPVRPLPQGEPFPTWSPTNITNLTPLSLSAGCEFCLGKFCQNMASLSKTTKLILLDSLLQEVCINSWRRWVARLRVRSGWVSILVSHKPSLFRAKESPLKTDLSNPWTNHSRQRGPPGGSLCAPARTGTEGGLGALPGLFPVRGRWRHWLTRVHECTIDSWRFKRTLSKFYWECDRD